VPQTVADAMTDYLLHHNANTHWEYPTSAETDALIAEARQTLADFFNCAPHEVSFGANMTTITFHVARAIGRGLQPGDEIVTTELDHHANQAPWQALARERGVTIRTVRMLTETGQLDGDDLASKLNEKTKVLAIGAASNALGTINDLQKACAMARAVGALSYVDAVHYAPHTLPDVQVLGCDFMACSAYKFYGPHIGVLYGRHELLAALDVPKLDPAPNEAPDRLETGTQNHEGIVGAAAAINFLASLSDAPTRRARLVETFAVLHERGHVLLRQLWEGLHAIDGVSVFGPAPEEPRTPTLSFAVRGVSSTEVARRLVKRGIYVSHGDFYAATVVERLGYAADGLVRAGCACYTTAEEIERLLAGVSDIARQA
jgi:cysteine desulfurase family protein (TIGR01976 family)